MSSPRTRAQHQQTKQLLNRLTHAKRAYNNAQRKALALKRQYHKAAFLFLYGQNQPHRTNLIQAEVQAIRNIIPRVRTAYMSNRVLSRSLPRNLVNRIVGSTL